MLYVCTAACGIGGYMLLFLNPVDSASVIAALISVCAAGVNIYCKSPKAVSAFSIANFIGCFFGYPFMCFWQPLVFFSAYTRDYLTPALCAASLIIFGSSTGLNAALFIIGECVLSYVLGELYRRNLKSLAKANEIRDSQTQKNIKLAKKNKSLEQSIAAEVESASFKERERIAGEMHDSTGHMLARAILMTAALKTSVKDGDIKEDLNSLEATLKAAMDSIRASVHKLKEDAVNLDRVAKNCAAGFPNFKCAINYRIEKDAPAAVKYLFASAIRECFSNAARHSDADAIDISIEEHPAFYKLVFTDNGNPPNDFSYGMGLSNIAERAGALGGRARFYVKDGFYVHITLPKENAALS